MTIDDFWKKYNHCPLCSSYKIQGALCDGCKWCLPIFEHRIGYIDKFSPTSDCIRMMNRMIAE